MQHLSSYLTVAAAVLLATLIGFLLGRFARHRHISAERKDAIKRSGAVILGAVYEKVLPFLPDFPYAPKDMVFIGKGFDYLVLDGLSEGTLRKIVFLEVKSGGSRLNANEKMISAVVQDGPIEWEEYRI
jgi:predicted Holliday junction resolvase-like endonuclease